MHICVCVYIYVKVLRKVVRFLMESTENFCQKHKRKCHNRFTLETLRTFKVEVEVLLAPGCQCCVSGDSETCLPCRY